MLEAELEWTFPLSFAEVVTGDGHQVFRQRIDLSGTEGFGKQQVRVPLDLAGRTWARFEVWDIAGNGAYTQPVWIGPKTETAPAPGSPVALTSDVESVMPVAKEEPSVWKWTKADPGHDWVRPDFDDSQWAEGRSAFGTPTTPGTDDILNTIWDTKDIWLRREVTLSESQGGKHYLWVHHDNHAEIYINGILAWRSSGTETRDYQTFEIMPKAAAELKPGATVTISAHGKNVLGGQVLDVGLVRAKD